MPKVETSRLKKCNPECDTLDFSDTNNSNYYARNSHDFVWYTLNTSKVLSQTSRSFSRWTINSLRNFFNQGRSSGITSVGNINVVSNPFSPKPTLSGFLRGRIGETSTY